MDQDLLDDNLKQLYVHYKHLEQWTDEQLQTRKEELVHLMSQLPIVVRNPVEGKHAHRPGLTMEYNDTYMSLSGMWHDIDEEEEARAYYVEHPSPTRAEFNAIQQRINK